MTLLHMFLKLIQASHIHGVNTYVDVRVVYFGDQHVLKMDHLCLGLNVCIFLSPLQTLEFPPSMDDGLGNLWNCLPKLWLYGHGHVPLHLALLSCAGAAHSWGPWKLWSDDLMSLGHSHRGLLVLQFLALLDKLDEIKYVHTKIYEVASLTNNEAAKRL